MSIALRGPSMLNRRRSGASRRQSRQLDPRRWRRWTGIGMLIVLLGIAGWSVQRALEPGRFPLRQVQFQGQLSYLDREELRQLIIDQLGRNFFQLDLVALRQRLLAHPWIAGASLRRDWPDGLEVKLSERQPYAYWGEQALIDALGQPFQPVPKPERQPWPKLAGPEGQGPLVIDHYRRFNALLAPLDLPIDSLTLDPRGAWIVGLSSGLTLYLGRNDVTRRLQRFVILYPTAVRPRLTELAAVDLRYNNGAALRWLELPDSAETLALERSVDRPLRLAHGAGPGQDN